MIKGKWSVQFAPTFRCNRRATRDPFIVWSVWHIGPIMAIHWVG